MLTNDALIRELRETAAKLGVSPVLTAEVTLRGASGAVVSLSLGAAEMLERPRPVTLPTVPAADEEEQDLGLNEIEATIVQVCRDAGRPLTRKEIATDERVNRSPESGAFRDLLNDMVDRKVLARGPGGKNYTIFSPELSPEVSP